MFLKKFKVFEYAKNPGITTELIYPYVSIANKQCGLRRGSFVANDKGYYQIRPGDELGLKHAVAKHGPVVVGICGYKPGFKFYKSGRL